MVAFQYHIDGTGTIVRLIYREWICGDCHVLDDKDIVKETENVGKKVIFPDLHYRTVEHSELRPVQSNLIGPNL